MLSAPILSEKIRFYLHWKQTVLLFSIFQASGWQLSRSSMRCYIECFATATMLRPRSQLPAPTGPRRRRFEQ